MDDKNDLVLRAMRLAEKAHRTREAGSHSLGKAMLGVY